MRNQSGLGGLARSISLRSHGRPCAFTLSRCSGVKRTERLTMSSSAGLAGRPRERFPGSMC